MTKKISKYSIITSLLALAILVSFLTVSGFPAPAKKMGEQFNLSMKTSSQFKLDIAYTYVGKNTDNASYTDSKGHLMSLISQYPSAIILNVTRVSGGQIASCESEVEVYGIHLTTDKGTVENHAYFVGTNYNVSFPASRLISLESHINELVDKKIYSAIKGDFYFNCTARKSFLSIPIGSIGEYSTKPSTKGLWDAGIPNAISISINRIGYVTINRNTTTVYVDAKPTSVATAHLSNFGTGFLDNKLVPTVKLPQTNLFHPSK
jgi:hypothetical protein